jgi:Zn-dependent protease
MTCLHCGAYYQQGQRFCTGCGRDLLPQYQSAGSVASPAGQSTHTGGWYLDESATSPAYGASASQQSIYPGPGPSTYAGQRSRRSGKSGAGGLGAGAVGLLALLSKLKGLLLLLKFGKFGATAITMVVSVAAYAAFFGLSFAVGFVLLLLVHEMGHWVVLRQKGVAAGAPVFIPFLGALIGMRGRPRNVKDEAEIGIGGPIAGTAASLLTGIVAAMLPAGHTQSLLYALGYTGLLLNLFNLIPVSPLDGGRVTAAISRWAWPVGLVLLVALFVTHPSGILGLILLLGGFETFRRFTGADRSQQAPGYYDIALQERIALALVFFGLLAVAFGGMELLHNQLLAIQGGAV